MVKNKVQKMGKTSPTTQPLVVRKARLGEYIYRTGNAECRYCVKIQERTSKRHTVIDTRYHLVTGKALSALSEYANLVVFHEALTSNGDRIAHPLMLCRDPLIPEDFDIAESMAFDEPVTNWLLISKDDEDGEYHYCSDYFEELSGPSIQEFTRDLEAALAPYAVDNQDHPLVRLLNEDIVLPSDDLHEASLSAVE